MASDPLFDESDLPVILDRRIFGAIEQLARAALQHSDNHSSARAGVNIMLQELRRLSRARLGHDSAECLAIMALLRRTAPGADGSGAAGARPDPLDHLETLGKLSARQSSAAHLIRDVWTAFSRYTSIGSRAFGKGSSGQRGRPLGPIEVMGPSVLNKWRAYYTPWYNKARWRSIATRGNEQISHVSVVFDVLVNLYSPAELDMARRLERGDAMRILLYELDMFYKRRTDDPCDVLPDAEEEDE